MIEESVRFNPMPSRDDRMIARFSDHVRRTDYRAPTLDEYDDGYSFCPEEPE